MTPTGLTRNPALLLAMAIGLVGCFQQPTRQELLDADTARREQCDDMLKEIDDNKDRPLIRATLQENYNQTCVSNYPAPPG